MQKYVLLIKRAQFLGSIYLKKKHLWYKLLSCKTHGAPCNETVPPIKLSQLPVHLLTLHKTSSCFKMISFVKFICYTFFCNHVTSFLVSYFAVLLNVTQPYFYKSNTRRFFEFVNRNTQSSSHFLFECATPVSYLTLCSSRWRQFYHCWLHCINYNQIIISLQPR